MNKRRNQSSSSLCVDEQARLRELEEEVIRLRKTNEVLLDRVEHRINVEGGAFAAFQAASNLEKTVADRTTELRLLNERLEHELDLRRSFETALLRAKTQAEEATASRTRFVAAASHDLRQPLNAAVLYLETIDQQLLSSADAESLRGVELALGTLNNLLATLLDISRLDSGGLHPEPANFGLQGLFKRLAVEYGSIADTTELELKVRPTSLVVNSDIMLLETVLRNLLSNAIKYTDRGRVLMGVRRRGDKVSIQVTDTGSGISAEHLEKIFQDFWRAPGASSGVEGSMGLGLSIVQRICLLLGSNIQVKSAPGKGSTFSLELPRGDGKVLDSPVHGDKISQGLGFNRCVVAVVDDNTQGLRSMARLLGSWDCRVVAATAVEEVLTTVIDQDITPQLIIADYHLAEDYKGLSAIEAINAEIALPAPAIMISSDNSVSLVEVLDKLGIPLLTKPVDPARLRAMMHHLLLQERD
jgi:signal transduction histidine kinase/CheY-like chemotaxis protein